MPFKSNVEATTIWETFMRALMTALVGAALIATATPAFAHHKLNHPDVGSTAVAARAHRDPCGAVSNNPHQSPGEQAIAERCRQLHAQTVAAPTDVALRERCNQAAMARTGAPCDHART